MLLALADHWETHLTSVLWVAASVAAAAMLLQIIVMVRRRRVLGSYYWLVGGIAAALVIVVGWNYFGWTTLYTDTGGSARHHRFFGRVLVIAGDINGDWRADAKTIYRWSDPWNPDHSNTYSYRVAKEDVNLDGRWDTWWEPVGPSLDGKVQLRLTADTDLDGKPDFEAIELSDSEATSYREIRQLRGF